MPDTPMTGNVFDTVRQEYYSLTAAEKKVADFVMSHHAQTQYFSIAELAEASGVAEATVTRFCRRLRFKGYSAFKLAVANAAALQRLPADAPPAGALTGDGLEELCQKLYAGRTKLLGNEFHASFKVNVSVVISILLRNRLPIPTPLRR